MRERVTRLESDVHHLRDSHGNATLELRGIKTAIDELKMALTKIGEQRAAEVKGAERWKTAAFSVAVALVVGMVVWIARIAMIVQGARAAAGAP